ncbi:MAG: helix-turn-helix domain-containing protein [Thiohalocapsa sp.]|nr:helix-turn-helix domain-containing protein [Thiohalocapsa sp.]
MVQLGTTYVSMVKPLDQLREVPRTQRRSPAKPLAVFARHDPDRDEAMARAFRTGVDSKQEIAAFLGVHDSTVSRAIGRFEASVEFTSTERTDRRDA